MPDPDDDLPVLPAPIPRTPHEVLRLLLAAETIEGARGHAAAAGFLRPFEEAGEGQRLLAVCRRLGTTPSPFNCLRLILAVAGARYTGDQAAALEAPLAAFLDGLEKAEAEGKLLPLPLPAVPDRPTPPLTVRDLLDHLDRGDVGPLAEDPAVEAYIAACARAGRDPGNPAALRALVLEALAAGGELEAIFDRTLSQLLGGPGPAARARGKAARGKAAAGEDAWSCPLEDIPEEHRSREMKMREAAAILYGHGRKSGVNRLHADLIRGRYKAHSVSRQCYVFDLRTVPAPKRGAMGPG